jgi:hypothetical protein
MATLTVTTLRRSDANESAPVVALRPGHQIGSIRFKGKYMTPTPSKQDQIIVRTNRMIVWFGEYMGEDARYVLLRSARRITPDIMASAEISHFAKNGTSKSLPPTVESVRIPVGDVAEIITPSGACVASVLNALTTQTRREAELSILHRATDADVNPYQSTFGT